MRTKNILGTGLLGLLFLSSCADDLYQTKPLSGSGREISFKTFADKQLRASVTTASSMTSFTTSAWSHPTGNVYDGYVLNGVTVTRGEEDGAGANNWEYFPKASWPATGVVDFFAYSPASSVNVTTGLKQAPSVTIPPATGPEIQYTVPGWDGGGTPTVDQQEDFLVTKNVNLTFASSPTVQLNFKHALSRIVFKAQNQNQYKTYVITELALSNLKSKGTLNMLDSLPNAGATFPHTPGAYNISWKAQSDSVTYKVDLGSTNVYVPYSTGTSSADYTAITNASNGLMVMPQATVLGAFLGTTPEYGTAAEVDPALTDATYLYATVAEVNYLTNDTVNTRQVVFRLHDPADKAVGIVFEAGKQYTFLLTLGLDGGVITFSVPDVTAFNESAMVDVPPAPPVGTVVYALGDLYPNATTPRGVVLTVDATGEHGTIIVPFKLTTQSATGTPIAWASSTETAREYAIRAYTAESNTWTGPNSYPVFEQLGVYYGNADPSTWPTHAFANWDDLALLTPADQIVTVGDDKVLHLDMSAGVTTFLAPLVNLIHTMVGGSDPTHVGFNLQWGGLVNIIAPAPDLHDADIELTWDPSTPMLYGRLENAGFWTIWNPWTTDANTNIVQLLIESF
ncbi:hypothetical protein FACS1894162_3070 [Bacteroidia bacterium]|nr:hypothetical protein FACS1894162_3070 [Bacteroidia bacterium]